MAGFLNTIGLASEVLGIVSFALDNAPEEKDKGASVSIRAGLGDDNNPETVCNFPWQVKKNCGCLSNHEL